MDLYNKSRVPADHNQGKTSVELKVTNFGAQSVIGIDRILKHIDRLPQFHLQRLKEITYDPQRLMPVIAGGDMETVPSNAQGLFIQSHRTIAIHHIESEAQFLHVLFHELGHHVYFQVIGSQLKKRWVTEICRNDGFVSEYAARNAAEDFAECYVAYLLEPDEFKSMRLKYRFFKESVFNQQGYVLQADRVDFLA